ncbi:MAG: sugar transferase [Armatimonadota bacterium]
MSAATDYPSARSVSARAAPLALGRTRYGGWPKRLLDLLGALLLLPGALVLMTLAAIAIKLTSRGPVLYLQRRVGRGGREFVLPKLRTMVDGAERDTGPVWAAPADPRITAVGGLLRRYHIDELPQLWCVLRGEMSLIGPRPERPHFVRRLRERLPGYDERVSVRPGISGWAQMHRPPDRCIADVAEKLRWDLQYVRHLSLGLDLSIALATVYLVLTNRLVR